MLPKPGFMGSSIDPGRSVEDGRAMFNIAGTKYRIVGVDQLSLSGRLRTVYWHAPAVRQDRRTNRINVGIMDIAPIKTQRDYPNALSATRPRAIASRAGHIGRSLGAETLSVRSSGPGGSDQELYGPEWASTARSHSLHRLPQPGARGPQSQALALAQNDLAIA